MAKRLNVGVSPSLRTTFADLCRSARIDLDISQAALAQVAGVSRAYIASIETRRANPTLDRVGGIAEALGVDLQLIARRQIVPEPRNRDLVHARMSGYAHRRLEGMGFRCLREIEISEGRWHGWIDLLAFHQASGTLLVIEIKSALLDIGAVERQLGWYERHAIDVAGRLRWKVTRRRSWLLCLASSEVDDAVRLNRDVLRMAFPIRAAGKRKAAALLTEGGSSRGLALIDPSRRRQGWLLPTRSDGRRSPAPYRNRADAAEQWRLRSTGHGRASGREANGLSR